MIMMLQDSTTRIIDRNRNVMYQFDSLSIDDIVIFHRIRMVCCIKWTDKTYLPDTQLDRSRMDRVIPTK